MRIRQLLIATASLGFLLEGAGGASAGAFGSPDPTPADKLPQSCVAAGATTAAECAALQRKTEEPAAEAKPAPRGPFGEKPPAEKPPAKAPEPAAEPEAPPAAKPEAPQVKPVVPEAAPAEARPADHHPNRPPAPDDVAKPSEKPVRPETPAAPEKPVAPAAAAPVEPAPPAPAVAPEPGQRPAHGRPHAGSDTPPAGPIPGEAGARGQRPPHQRPTEEAPVVVPATPAEAAPAAAAPEPASPPPARPAAVKPQPAPEAAAPAPAAPQRGVFGQLPKGVSPQQVAPLFDSAKDAETGDGPAAGRPVRPGHGAPHPARPAGPPPANDEAAQTGIRPGDIPPIDKTQGQPIGRDDRPSFAQHLPPGAKIVQPGSDDRFAHRGPPGQGPGKAGGPNPASDPLALTLGTIVQLGSQLIINSPGQDQRRIAGGHGDNTDYESLPGGRYRETVSRPNGVRIVTVYDQSGDVLRRSRFDQNGHETVLAYFDARQDGDLSNWRDPGDDLPPLQLNIAPQDYVLDADQASESQVQRFFAEPPVEHVQRLYSIDEVKRSARIRDMVRRLEIGDLTFDTGEATIAQDQVQNLSTVAQGMLGLLRRNPGETFLIEGHTDAVGSDISNLQLSDARAATVADILTDFYHIPPENLVTQGYGERFLTVQTDGPERLNRRVTIRRITPLITVANQPD